MKEAQIVEKIRAQEGISHRDALKVFQLQLSENNHGSHAVSTKTSNRYMPQSALSSAASNEPRTWAQKVKSQQNQTVQTVSTGTQTQDELTPSTLQGITVNKFIELMCKIISFCKSSDNLDIAKTVTDLTKETLQCNSPVIAHTNAPVSTSIVPQPDPSTGMAQVSSGESGRAAFPRAVETEIEDFTEPSPVLGKRTSKVTQGPSKPKGNLEQGRGKSKSKGIKDNILVTKDKANSFKKCRPSMN